MRAVHAVVQRRAATPPGAVPLEPMPGDITGHEASTGRVCVVCVHVCTCVCGYACECTGAAAAPRTRLSQDDDTVLVVGSAVLQVGVATHSGCSAGLAALAGHSTASAVGSHAHLEHSRADHVHSVITMRKPGVRCGCI